MKILKRKNLLVLILSCILLLSIVGIVLANVRTLLASESDFVLSQTEYNTEYVVGDTVTVTDETISFESEDYQTKKSVIMPDGTSKTCDSFVITQTGKYQIVYKAKIDNKVVTKRINFMAKSELYSVSHKNSSATYGKSAYLPETVKGINLSLVSNDTFSFNKVIDLSKLSSQDDIIKFYITPKNVGVAEFAEMVVTLTDIYDTNNQVKFYFSCTLIQSTITWKYLYTTACATGQERTGLLYDYRYQDTGEPNPEMIYLDNAWFSIHSGIPSAVSYTGEVARGDSYVQQYGKANGEVTFADNYQFIRMDYPEKKVYTQYGWSKFNLLTDLDNSAIVGENVWKGFTTGEAVVDISFNGLAASSANVFITDIAGVDLTEFNFVDQTPPFVSVDFGEFEEGNVPVAYLDQAYPLFSAKAIDSIDKELVSTAKVYYNYYGSAKTLVNIVDGKFTPKRAGIYTIEYSAVDSMGNKGVKCVDITCLDEYNDFKINLSQDRETTSLVSQTIRVADFSLENATGTAKVMVSATLKNDPTVSYILDNEELSFRPFELGEFVIKYEATDFFKTISDSYSIMVTKESRPIFANEPIVPRAFIKGSTYTFDKLTAYDYSSGTLNEVETEVWLAKDAGTAEKLTNNLYTVGNESEVTLTYKATTADGVAEKTYTIPVIDVSLGVQEALDSTKYFMGEGFTTSATEYYVKVQKDYTAQTAKFGFINKILLSKCEVDFSFIEELNNFATISMVLTDLADTQKQVVISFAKNGNIVTISVNGSGEYVLEDTVDIMLDYDYTNDILNINVDEIAIDMSKHGITPKSFSTPLTWLDFEFDGIATDKAVGIGISNIMGQIFSNLPYDLVRPAIYETDTAGRLFAKGDKVTLYPIYFVDAIDPNPSAKFSVSIDGKYNVYSEDGILLKDVTDLTREYVIELEKYGDYDVEYLFTDSYENAQDHGFSITVKDMDAPEVTIPSSAQTAYVRGDTVSVARPKIKDDSRTSTTVYVCNADGVVVEVKSYSFKAEKAGIYTVFYYVLDANNNLTIASYQITVGEPAVEEGGK